MVIGMKKVRDFVKWFLYITVGILIVCGINYGLSGMDSVPVDVFGMILSSAFVTAFVTALVQPQEQDGKAKSVVKYIVHYIMLCVIMSFLGTRFGWINFEWKGIVSMSVDVGIVYLLVFVAYYLVDVRQADRINKVLKEKYGDEE